MSADSTSLSPRAEMRATALIYSASFSYMITLGASLVLVPLYLLHLEFNYAELGIIVASQAFFGLFLRLFAGAMADQFGERWVLWASYSTLVIGSALFGLFGTFWTLIAAQTFLGVSRALYWTSTQSYGSRINPDQAATKMGRMSSSGTVGQLGGVFIIGFIAGGPGYGWAWATIVLLGVFGLLGSLALPVLPRKQAVRGFKQAVAPIPGMFRSPSMGLSGYCAFMASTSMTVAVILLVPYLRELGNEESVVTTIRTVGFIGSIGLGFTLGRIVALVGQRNLYMLSFSLMFVTLSIVPVAGEGIPAMTILMFLYGTVHGVLGPLYPVTAATFSSQEQRGMAMGYIGLYWGVAQIVVPAALGVIASAIGLRDAFWFAAGFFLLAALATPALWQVLTRHVIRAEATA